MYQFSSIFTMHSMRGSMWGPPGHRSEWTIKNPSIPIYTVSIGFAPIQMEWADGLRIFFFFFLYKVVKLLGH